MTAPFIETTDRFQPRPHVAYRKIGGKVVIVQPLRSNMLTLNETGSEIWSLLGQCDVGQIGRRLSDAFKVEEAQALVDTREFLHDMLERELVEKAGG